MPFLDTLRRQSSFEDKQQCKEYIRKTFRLFDLDNESVYHPFYNLNQLYMDPDAYVEANCVQVPPDSAEWLCDVYDADFHTDVADACDGEIETIDFVTNDGPPDYSRPLTITGMPLCLGNSTCEGGVDSVFMFNFGKLIGINMRYTGTTGIQCLEHTLSNYGLELDFFGVLVDVDEDEPLYMYYPGQILGFSVEDTEVLKNETDVCEKTSMVGELAVVTCNLSDYDFGDMASICLDKDGHYTENDLTYEGISKIIDGNAEIKLLNFPICISNQCSSDEEGITYLNYLLEVALGSDIRFQPSPSPTLQPSDGKSVKGKKSAKGKERKARKERDQAVEPYNSLQYEYLFLVI